MVAESKLSQHKAHHALHPLYYDRWGALCAFQSLTCAITECGGMLDTSEDALQLCPPHREQSISRLALHISSSTRNIANVATPSRGVRLDLLLWYHEQPWSTAYCMCLTSMPLFLLHAGGRVPATAAIIY